MFKWMEGFSMLDCPFGEYKTCERCKIYLECGGIDRDDESMYVGSTFNDTEDLLIEMEGLFNGRYEY